ncbi:MAG TPA: hypothetical protein VF658_04975 [Pyrinomonadaceae bacterium]
MAAVRYIKAQQRNYTVVADVQTFYRALISGSVRDEITGEPIKAQFGVSVNHEGIDVRTLEGGLFGLAGYLERVFPDLSNTDYGVELSISAPGYREATQIVNLPHNSSLPLIAPPVQLRRLPVRLQGRVVEETSDRLPIPDAKIIAVNGPSASAPVAFLRSPLHFDHASGTSIRECNLAVAGTAKTIMADAAAGSRILSLSNRAGLAVDALLRIGPETSAEYALIESLEPLPADLNQPGKVTLRSALRHSFPAQTVVRQITHTIPMGGEVRTLSSEAQAGDGLILLNAFLDVDGVEVLDPVAARVEYHALGARTNGDGFFRLDGVGRLRAVDLDASASGFQPLAAPAPFAINYEQPVNVVNFRLQP